VKYLSVFGIKPGQEFTISTLQRQHDSLPLVDSVPPGESCY